MPLEISEGSHKRELLYPFIAYVIWRAQRPFEVSFYALFLLLKLKAKYPRATYQSGHRLFLISFMLAAKLTQDNAYANMAWRDIGMYIFPLEHLNEMERNMCKYLDWNFNVDPMVFRRFERAIRKKYVGNAPYPPAAQFVARYIAPAAQAERGQQ